MTADRALLVAAVALFVAAMAAALAFAGAPAGGDDAGPVDVAASDEDGGPPTADGGGPASAATVDPRSSPDLSERGVEAEIHAAVNEVREEHGYERLEWDPELRPVAIHHSVRMGREGFFSHTAPDGESMGDRYDRFGYECRADGESGLVYAGGENLVLTYHDTRVAGHGYLSTEAELAEAAVEGWMDSPGHRENLLEDHWSVHAIGVYATDDDEVYVTQNFC